MKMIDALELDCEVIETDQFGSEKIFKGFISELHYNTAQEPYQVQVTWNGKTRLIQPKFHNGAMSIKRRNGRGTIDIFIAE